MDIQLHSNSTTQYQIKSKTFKGRKHIVVPVVMMVEGVHSGSRGPLLHLASELGRFPASWNGIPVMIKHPQIEGNFVSANSPEVLESAVGTIFNTKMENGKLKAEAWIDEEKIKAISTQALAYIRQGRPLDVSIGVFTDEEETQGNFNGEDYSAIARNHRPDHLALLPGEQGACSWADGCGIRANSSNASNNKTEKDENVMEDNRDINSPEALEAMKLLNGIGYSFTPINANEAGYREIMDKVRMKLDSMDTQTTMHYLEDVYEDYVIYVKQTRPVTDSAGTVTGTPSRKLLKQSYEIANGEVNLTGNPVEVVKKVEVTYTTNNLQRTKFNNNKKPETMADNKSSCFLGKVERVINSNSNNFGADDREWLLAQEEGTLDKLLSKPEDATQVNAEQAVQVFKATIKTADDAIALAPESDRQAMKDGLKLYQEKRKQLVDSIVANSKGTWTEEELTAMSQEMLEKISKTASLEIADYSGNGGAPTPTPQNNVGMEEVLLPTGIKVETKK